MPINPIICNNLIDGVPELPDRKLLASMVFGHEGGCLRPPAALAIWVVCGIQLRDTLT